MKNLIKVTILTLALGFTALYAHGSHSHKDTVQVKEETSKASIKEIAKQKVKSLTLEKKVDSSWLFIPISKIKKTPSNNEWIVSFKNSKIQDKEKQTLYIFVTVYGKLTGANYTGK